MSQVIQKQIGVFQNFEQYVRWVREVKRFTPEEVDEAALLYGWSQAALHDDDMPLIMAVLGLEYLRELKKEAGTFRNVKEAEDFAKSKGIDQEFNAKITLLLNSAAEAFGAEKITDTVLQAIMMFRTAESVKDGSYLQIVTREREKISSYFQHAGINDEVIH